MDNLWLTLFWSGPISLGVFFAVPGIFIWLTAKANEINKHINWEVGVNNKYQRDRRSRMR